MSWLQMRVVLYVGNEGPNRTSDCSSRCPSTLIIWSLAVISCAFFHDVILVRFLLFKHSFRTKCLQKRWLWLWRNYEVKFVVLTLWVSRSQSCGSDIHLEGRRKLFFSEYGYRNFLLNGSTFPRNNAASPPERPYLLCRWRISFRLAAFFFNSKLRKLNF